MKFIVICLGIFASLFGIFAIAYAAPAFTPMRSILPEITNTYDLGTTTKVWNGVYTKNLTITGTCTGCGASAAASTTLLSDNNKWSGQNEWTGVYNQFDGTASFGNTLFGATGTQSIATTATTSRTLSPYQFCNLTTLTIPAANTTTVSVVFPSDAAVSADPSCGVLTVGEWGWEIIDNQSSYPLTLATTTGSNLTFKAAAGAPFSTTAYPVQLPPRSMTLGMPEQTTASAAQVLLIPTMEFGSNFASTTMLTTTTLWMPGQSAGCAQFDSNAKLTSTGVNCGTGGSSFGWPFPNNATSTMLTFSGGLMATASSTFTATTTFAGVMNIGNTPNRPLFNLSTTTLIVSATSTYTTIQSALDVVPIHLQYPVKIIVQDGTYNEDLIVWPSYGQRFTKNRTNEWEPFSLVGNTTTPSSVAVGSLTITGLQGAGFGFHGFSLSRNNPYDNETSAIGVYGSDEVNLGNIKITGGTRGITCYDSVCDLEEKFDLGTGILVDGIRAKHGARIYLDNGYNPTVIGTVTHNVYDPVQGTIFSNSTTATATAPTAIAISATTHDGYTLDTGTHIMYGLSGFIGQQSPAPYISLVPDFMQDKSTEAEWITYSTTTSRGVGLSTTNNGFIETKIWAHDDNGSNGTIDLMTGTGASTDATTRLTVIGNGNVGLSTTTPMALLSLAGTTGIVASTTATSTFYGGGINLVTAAGNTGCFAVNGACVTGGGSLATPVSIANGGTATTSMYSGGVLFYDGTLNTVSQAGNGTGLFYDRTNNRLGIATTTPPAPLTVTGNVTFANSNFVLTDSGSTDRITMYAASKSSPPLTNAVSGGIYTSATGGAAYPFLEAGNLVLQPRTSSGQIKDTVIMTGGTTPAAGFVFSRLGYFGVGTTSPQWPGTFASSTLPQLGLSDNNNNIWTMRSAGGDLYVATSSAANFATSSVSSLIIRGNGAASLAVGSTTQTFSAVNGLLTLGQHTGATSTVSMGKVQIDGYSSAGARICMFVVGTTLTIISGGCTL